MDEDLELPAWPKEVKAPKLVCFDLDDTIWFPEMYAQTLFNYPLTVIRV
jgi:hypothetical protein